MSHHCPTCSETCYCMGDHTEINSGHRAYCMHCRDEPVSKEPIDPEFPDIDDMAEFIG